MTTAPRDGAAGQTADRVRQFRMGGCHAQAERALSVNGWPVAAATWRG